MLKKVLTFEELKDIYQSKNYHCGSVQSYTPGYGNKRSQITRLGCNAWACKKCRPNKVQELYNLVTMAMYRYDMTRHLVITFPGEEVREKIPFYQSFKLMNIDWKLFLKVLKYRLEEEGLLTDQFGYIKFPRAQQNGYCHHHVILNQWIPKEFIDEAAEGYDFGFTSISYNQSLADYLKDFKKDIEYVIPFNLKHYSSSQNVKVNPGQGYLGNPENLVVSSHMGCTELEQIIFKKYNKVAPLELYLRWFNDVVRQQERMQEEQYRK